MCYSTCLTGLINNRLHDAAPCILCIIQCHIDKEESKCVITKWSLYNFVDSNKNQIPSKIETKGKGIGGRDDGIIQKQGKEKH